MKPSACFAWLLPLITILVAAGTQAQHAPNRQPSSVLARELAAAKREGFPVSAKDLQAPLPPEDQNAAPLYTRLDQLLKTKPLSQADTAPEYAGGSLLPPPAQMEQIRRALADRRDVVDLIHQAVSRPKCVFVIDWSKSPSVVADNEFPKEARLREVARWLAAESALQLYDKKPLDAVRTQALVFQVARHAASTPTLTSNLVAAAVDAIALGGMRRILYIAGNDPQVAAAVQQAIEKDRSSIDLGHALWGELALNLLFGKEMRQAGPDGLKTLLSEEGTVPSKAAHISRKRRQSFDRFMDESGALLLHTMREQIRAAERPYPEAISALKAIDAQIQRKAHTDPHYILAAITSPVYVQAAAKSANSEATAATVRCAAALLAWNAEHGAFPATLAEAITPVPADPFTGKPLPYRQEGKGFIVYSVGASGKFNGGNPDKAPPRTEALFRYPLPVYARQPIPFLPGMGGPVPGGISPEPRKEREF
jgi:hypothetical protein